jgi:hypothetical protein
MTSHLEALATMSMSRLAHYHQQQRDVGRSNETEHHAEGSLIDDEDDDDDNLNQVHVDDGWLWDLMQRTNEVVALLQQVRPPLEAPLLVVDHPRPADDPPT